MKTRKIGVAALLGLVSAAATATSPMAQCNPDPSIMQINMTSDVFAYETAYDPLTYLSSGGSVLTVVGRIASFCAPLSFLNANITSGAAEYTFIWTLTSAGTVKVVTTVTPTKFITNWDTDYTGGTLAIYEDFSPDSPTLATLAASPPNAQVPGTFTDGTPILTGAFDTFHTKITQTTTGSFTSSFNSTLHFTGGREFPKVGGRTSNADATWCSLGTAIGQCQLPVGYSAYPGGKYDVVPVRSSTWGVIKQLYR